MSKTLLQSFIVGSLLLPMPLRCQGQPYGPNGFQGRIALSHDGNFNDEDDWGACPVAIAILDAFGVKDRLVHIEYNNILQANDPRFEREMTASVQGAAEQYDLPAAILHVIIALAPSRGSTFHQYYDPLKSNRKSHRSPLLNPYTCIRAFGHAHTTSRIALRSSGLSRISPTST